MSLFQPHTTKLWSTLFVVWRLRCCAKLAGKDRIRQFGLDRFDWASSPTHKFGAWWYNMENYHIYDEIGRGKFSVVYKARRKQTIDYVAVKSTEKSRMNKVKMLQ